VYLTWMSAGVSTSPAEIVLVPSVMSMTLPMLASSTAPPAVPARASSR
jgi:hypothetical protein